MEGTSSKSMIIETRILVGLASITATIILLGWIAINENARMEEFTQRSEARSIEAGARLFENNCTSCHGVDAKGLNGVAPALNNPQLFGFSFFGEIDSQKLVLESQLGSAVGEDRAAIQAEIAALDAERLALEEKILYDWTREAGHAGEQLDALDAEIVASGIATSGGRIAAVISQLEATHLAPLQQERDDLNARLETLAPPAEATTTEAPAAEGEAAPAEGEMAPAEGEAAPAEAEVAAADQCAFLTSGEALPDSTPIQLDGADAAAVTARLAEVEALITQVENCIAPYAALADERAALQAQQGRFQAVVDGQAEVERLRGELAATEAAIAALPAVVEGQTDPKAEERTTLTTEATDLTASLNAAIETRDTAYQALVDEGDVVHFDPNAPSRIVDMGWAGSLYDLVESTLVSGRPTSSSYWPQPMVAWAQTTGGPLRVDQIKNLTDYIMNFQKNWSSEMTVDEMVAAVREINQYARKPSFGAVASDAPTVGTDVAAILQGITDQTAAGDLVAGDPALGQDHFTARGCAGCHGEANGTGPARIGIWSRATEDTDGRLTQTGDADAQTYVIQSIVNPGAFVVPGFSDGIMPQTFGTQITYQELVDILAYIESLE